MPLLPAFQSRGGYEYAEKVELLVACGCPEALAIVSEVLFFLLPSSLVEVMLLFFPKGRFVRMES
ncbi:hypothetical protein [Methanosarcina acetivorans]|uniref:hypothetical protein n=1 Tax=Methanosarcina acetivorans TaxID=2214 RepID=UPI000AB2CBBA|nr:hypothetical protein [Methanosarcina acetivorans]